MNFIYLKSKHINNDITTLPFIWAKLKILKGE